MDLVGYDKYLSGQLKNYDLPDSVIAENIKELEGYPKPM
jgi:tryptophan synthase beta chain